VHDLRNKVGGEDMTEDEFERHAEMVVDQMLLGLLMFGVGQLGNLYHHYLLRTLRSEGKDDTRYRVPMGGLFSACGGVAAPHYLFELVSWWGIGICTKHWISVVFNLAMTAYLVDRAVAQDAWNRVKLTEDYPMGRKVIVPYLF
jgi:very-long-chain enoyl-CoA reductase